MSVRLSEAPPVAAAANLDLPLLRQRAQEILRALGRARSELSLSLVDDPTIAQLNGDYRAKPRPTDVLSFSLLEGEHQEHRGALLGDVVIGLEEAGRQARARRRSLDEVVAKLTIHGVLHLVGHDHERDEEARAMRAEERRLWAALRALGENVRRARS